MAVSNGKGTGHLMVIAFVIFFCFISAAAQTALMQESNNFGINRNMMSTNGTSQEFSTVTKESQMLNGGVSSSTNLTITVRKGSGFGFRGGGFRRRRGGGGGKHHSATGRNTAAGCKNCLFWISTLVLVLAF